MPSDLHYTSLSLMMASSNSLLVPYFSSDKVALQGIRITIATKTCHKDRHFVGMSLSSGGVIGQLSSPLNRTELRFL